MFLKGSSIGKEALRVTNSSHSVTLCLETKIDCFTLVVYIKHKKNSESITKKKCIHCDKFSDLYAYISYICPLCFLQKQTIIFSALST